MRFLADESCDFAAIRALRQAGHDVKSVREAFSGATDEQVLDLANGEKRLLLTEDKDFGRLFFAGAVESSGVVLIRFPALARSQLGAVIEEVVQTIGEDLKDSFAVVQPGRTRVVHRLQD